MGKRHYPAPPVKLNAHAMHKYRRTLDKIERWDSLAIDRAAHLAILETKIDGGGASPDELEQARRQRIMLGLA